jgi:hypothetical protein
MTFLKGMHDLSWRQCRRRDEGEGGILLGENTGGGAVLLRLIKFKGVGAWILTLWRRNYLLNFSTPCI